MGQFSKSFAHLEADEAKKGGTNQKGQKNHGVEFFGGDAETTTKSSDQRNGDNGNSTGNENEKFILDGFLEVQFDFFDQFPGNANDFAETID